MFVVWAIDGTVLSASDSYAHLVGCTVDEIVGRRWPELVPEEAAFCWQQLEFSVAALQTAPVLVVDMPTQAAGSTSWLRWTEWAVRDEHGELVQVRSTAVDVSELHETRAALAATIDAVVAARAAGRREMAEQLHNGAVQQLTAARWALSDGDVHGALGLVESALAAVRESVDTLDPPKVGVPLVSSSSVPAEWLASPVASAVDDPSPWLREVVEAVLEETVVVFSSTGVVWASPEALTQFGSTGATTDLASLLGLVHIEDRATVAAAFTTALAGQPAHLLWRFRHPVAGVRQLAARLAPFTSPTGEPWVVAVAVDITDQQAVALEDARQLERERLAADLHDDALQLLAGLRWMLTARDAAPELFTQVDLVDSSIREQVSRLLSPVEQLGFEGALRALAAATGTAVEVRVRGDSSAVPFPVGERIWRAARELLRNVDRHARARHATLDVAVLDHEVVLTVTDDGRGFGPDAWLAARREGHIGLAALRESAVRSGGRFSLETGPGVVGSRVQVTQPLV